jgi:tRNA(fMet)-specific endonuclease VapC
LKYLLDTNACIALLNIRPQHVRARLKQAWLDGHTVYLSTIVLHELFYGASKSKRVLVNMQSIRELLEESFDVMDFGLEAARASGEIRAKLERSGKRIGEYDTLIAGHALSLNMTLVTANTREFERVDGLKLADWT